METIKFTLGDVSVTEPSYCHFDCCEQFFSSFLGVSDLFEFIWWLNTIAWLSMGKCRVKNCENYPAKVGISPNIRFHKFPNELDRFLPWRKATGDDSLAPTSSIYICSVHFDHSAINLKDLLVGVPIRKRRLAENAVPTFILPANISSVLCDRSNHQETRAKKLDSSVRYLRTMMTKKTRRRKINSVKRVPKESTKLKTLSQFEISN